MLAAVPLLADLLCLSGRLDPEADTGRRLQGVRRGLAAQGVGGTLAANPGLAAGRPRRADAAWSHCRALRWSRRSAASGTGPGEPALRWALGLMLLCPASALRPGVHRRCVARRGRHHTAGGPGVRSAAAVGGLAHAAFVPRGRGSGCGRGRRHRRRRRCRGRRGRRDLRALHLCDSGAQGLDLLCHLLDDGGLQDALLVQLRRGVGALLSASCPEGREAPHRPSGLASDLQAGRMAP
mmetsp:Transcript_50642/g.157054  ORF Transcript_50642/g.157054 Transcript_50642/m.157054 type:complete len:238 (+) Transcript_50642:2086-2799(+)